MTVSASYKVEGAVFIYSHCFISYFWLDDVGNFNYGPGNW